MAKYEGENLCLHCLMIESLLLICAKKHKAFSDC